MSLQQFLRILWARRLLVFACTAFTFIGAIAVVLIVPPRYEASSRVIITALLKPDPLTEKGDPPFRDSATFAATQRELVMDYRVTSEVVDKLGWLTDPRKIEAYQRTSDDTRDFRRWLAEQVAKQTTVDFVAGTIMKISFASSSPVEARIGAETLRDSYIQYSVSSRRTEAARNAEWFQQQAEIARKAAEKAEVAKANFERANGIVMTGDGSDTRDIDSERLAALASATTVAPGQVAPTFSPTSIQLAQVDAEIAQNASKLGPNHPQMQELRARRATLASIVGQEQAAARRAASGGGQMEAVARALQDQKARVLGQRDKIEVARQMASEVQLRREQYKQTAARAAELSLQAGVSDSGLSPLGSVVTPSSPKFPNRPLIIVGSLGLGFGFGLLLSVLVELMNRRVRSIEDLHHEDGLDCLGVIGSGEPARVRPPIRFRAGQRLSPSGIL